MGTIQGPRSVIKGLRERDGVWLRRRRGRTWSGISSIWGTHGGGVGVQVPREDIDGDRRRLAGGGWESQEGAVKLGKAGQGT